MRMSGVRFPSQAPRTNMNKSALEYTNLNDITRNSDVAITLVTIQPDYRKFREAFRWLEFGEAELRNDERICWLDARLTAGVTDFEHDSAHALRLPLIGLTFQHLWYQNAYFKAWVNPNDPDGFRVPRAGYNPMKLPDAYTCESDYCKEEPHIVVPEGYYCPPYDEELYEAVRGAELEIIIGLRHKEK